MPVPARSANFSDLLDPRFQKIFDDTYTQLPDRLGEFFVMKGGGDFPTTADARYSQVGTLPDIPEFTGSVTYLDNAQGYDVTITYKEYAGGFQIERKLYDDDHYGVMDAKPRGLSRSFQRTRQKQGAQIWNNAFGLDTTWLNHSEGVALCSDAHTTTSGASTASGFDNLSTASLTAVALQAGRVVMRNFRGDQAERISVIPNLIVVPPDLEGAAWEIVNSQGKPEESTNTANISYKRYTVADWEYLTDANNWFLVDSSMMKSEEGHVWIDRIPSEFAMVEDFDSLIGKWRLYARDAMGLVNKSEKQTP